VAGSPTPNQHDILTGSTLDGMLMSGNTCGDWTGTGTNSQVGHADGLGPNMNSAPPYNQWAGFPHRHVQQHVARRRRRQALLFRR
jgi:hypothetical protein